MGSVKSVANVKGWPTVGKIYDTELAKLWSSGHV